MKLIIYETTHHETLPSILDLSVNTFERVTVFLKHTSYQLLCSNNIPEKEWPHAVFITQDESCKNRAFIKRVFTFINDQGYTHLHLSTLDNNFLYIAFKIFIQDRRNAKINISLSVQAVNEYAAFKFNNLRDITESVAKFYLHRRIVYHRAFFPKMVTILQQKFPKSTIVFIPSRFYLPSAPTIKEKKESFKIVIPGSVDPIRRDYAYVTSFFKEFLHYYDKAATIHLVILGNSNHPYGEGIINDLKNLEGDYFKVTYYKEYISQQEYERQLSDADILWSPLRVNTHGIRKTSEVYGVSTATGIMADLLFNNTPSFVPHNFEIAENYEAALISYSSERELSDLLIRFITFPDQLKEIKNKVGISFCFFTAGNFIDSFKKIMSIS